MVARVLIEVVESEVRARGRVDLAKVAREDRPLVVVGPLKQLAAAAAEMLAAAGVSAAEFQGGSIRTFRAELKRRAIDLEQAKAAPKTRPKASLGTLVGMDLSAKPGKRWDVRITVYSG